MLILGRERPDDPEVIGLFAERDAYLQRLYPERAQLRHAVELAAGERALLGVRQDGRLVGCGVLIEHRGFLEVKKVFLTAAARGKGLGRQLLAALETEARALGCTLLRLEVGARQPAAVRLYRGSGYVEADPFPPYRAEPASLFMEKRLEPADVRGRVGRR